MDQVADNRGESSFVKQPAEPSEVRRGVMRWAIKNVVFALIFAAILFLSSGRLGWGMAWVYLGLYALEQIVVALVLSPELLAERSGVQAGAKKWDVVLVGLAALYLPVAMYVVAGLDQRYGWTAAMSPGLQWAGVVVTALSMALFVWSIAANEFFSGMVRIQEDRGHQVVTGGPYRFVRHPGYVGAILHGVAAPILFGSLWALIPGVLVVAVMIVRTALEDRTLHEELPGYAEYAEQTRYRLLPGVW